MHGLKSAILTIFQQGRDGRALLVAVITHQESLTGFQKLVLLWVPMNSQQ